MTIKEIAEIANVSISTVSKVLNNKDESIGRATRENVLRVAKEYQYTPYSSVRKKGASQSNILGIIMPKSYRNKNELIDVMEHRAVENGYSIIISFTDDSNNNDEKAVKRLINIDVEGIVLLPRGGNKDLVKYIIGKKIPLVLLDYDKDREGVAQVYFNYEHLGFLATKYLLDMGHKNIGYLACKDTNCEGKEQGYIRALYDKGIIFDESKSYRGEKAKVTGELGVQKIVNRNITALICENSEIAHSAYGELNKKGMKIPTDISIISLEDSFVASLLNPGLTAIASPYKHVGETAIEELVDIILSKKIPTTYDKSLETLIVERNSVSYPTNTGIGQGKKILVVGSMNMDILISVPYIPTGGETIISDNTVMLPGGKGANQAVGAAKLGGDVYLLGRLGSDSDGKEIYNSLIENSVKADGVVFDTHSSTGRAYINVDKNAESTIVVYPGANWNLHTKQIQRFKYMFEDAEFCLLPLEMPEEIAEFTMDLCVKNNVQVILKPSAVDKINTKSFHKIAYMIPNEKELKMLVPGKGSIEEKAEYFYSNGVKNVIVTLGKKGCYLKNDKYSMFFPAAEFTALDTTGAADAFISALAVYLSEGNDVVSAIQFATYAAGLSVTRQGVQSSMPDRVTLNIYKDEMGTLGKELN